MLLRRVFFVAWMIILHSEILCQVEPDHLDNHINREKEDEEDDEDKDPYDGRLKFLPFSFSHNDIMEKQKSKLKGDSDFLGIPYIGFLKHGSPPQDSDGELKSHDDEKQGDHLSPTSYKVYGKKKKMKIMKSSQVMILQITNIHMNIRIIVLLGHIYLTAMSFTNSDKVL